MNKSETLKFDLIGKEFETAKSGKCFIIDYKRCNDVTVMFYEPMYVVKCEMGNLRKGNVNNPLYPNVFGVGCVGVGEYGADEKEPYSLFNNPLRLHLAVHMLQWFLFHNK